MTITNITDRERALSAEVQKLNGLVDDLVAGLNSHMERADALARKTAKQEKVLKLALDLIDNVIDDPKNQRRMDDTIDAIQEALADQPAQQSSCKRCNSYAMLVKSLEDQLSFHKRQADKYREAIASLESERAANVVLTEELEKGKQPAQQQEIDWKDQYEKQKRRAEMWIAKYEADIGPLEKAGPVTTQQQEFECPRCGHCCKE